MATRRGRAARRAPAAAAAGAVAAAAAPGPGLHNEDVAAAFDEMADLLSIEGENAFRIRAYRRAAQLIRGLTRELAQLEAEGGLESLPGIGADLAGKIRELLGTGRCKALEQRRRRVPAGVRALLALPGLGPVRVRALFLERGIRDAGELERALGAGRIAGLRGFGPGLCARLRAGLAARRRQPAARLPWLYASQYAEPLRAFLAAAAGVQRVEIAGSFRRGRDTVGDLDVLVCAAGPLDLRAVLRGYRDLRQMTAEGPTRAAGTLRNGLQVDFRVVRPESFGAALHYFTGSRDHNIHLRRIAQARGLKLSEYGLFRAAERIAGADEEEVYAALGLPWIPPELREDRGEIEAAGRQALPVLIEERDLRGDLHVHTSASDGTASLEDMVAAARARGLRYLAITDHAKYLGVTHGLDAERLARQRDAIDAINAAGTGLTVLQGAEVDILEDGRLSLPDEVLRRLDLVVIAIHAQLGLPAGRQTTRLLRALERPCVSILAHPGGRLIGEREPCVFDFERVLRAVRERPCYLEINSQPLRLDLDDVHARAARDSGILLSIASDAHATDQLALVGHGVRQARRAWVTREDVLNARPPGELRTLLARTMH